MLNPIFFEKLSDLKKGFGGHTKLFDICFCIVAHGYHVKFGADVDTRHLLMDNGHLLIIRLFFHVLRG